MTPETITDEDIELERLIEQRLGPVALPLGERRLSRPRQVGRSARIPGRRPSRTRRIGGGSGGLRIRRSFLDRRGFVIPEDVKSVLPWLARHRLNAVSGYSESPDEQIAEMLRQLPIP